MSPVSSGKQKEEWRPLAQLQTVDGSAVVSNWLGVRKVEI